MTRSRKKILSSPNPGNSRWFVFFSIDNKYIVGFWVKEQVKTILKFTSQKTSVTFFTEVTTQKYYCLDDGLT